MHAVCERSTRKRNSLRSNSHFRPASLASNGMSILMKPLQAGVEGKSKKSTLDIQRFRLNLYADRLKVNSINY